LIDISADKLISLPPVLTSVPWNSWIAVEGVTVRNFLIVALKITNFHSGSFDLSFRLLDLERPGLGWHIIDPLVEESHFEYRFSELIYLEDEKCILAYSYRDVRKLDLSAAFETGTLKYKATIPSIARKELPDGLLPHILACGNTLPQPDLNFRVLQSRMDVLCNVQRIETTPVETNSGFLSSMCIIL
jgi:hypothetical protein